MSASRLGDPESQARPRHEGSGDAAPSFLAVVFKGLAGSGILSRSGTADGSGAAATGVSWVGVQQVGRLILCHRPKGYPHRPVAWPRHGCDMDAAAHCTSSRSDVTACCSEAQRSPWQPLERYLRSSLCPVM